jgi:hypothetical protein
MARTRGPGPRTTLRGLPLILCQLADVDLLDDDLAVVGFVRAEEGEGVRESDSGRGGQSGGMQRTRAGRPGPRTRLPDELSLQRCAVPKDPEPIFLSCGKGREGTESEGRLQGV